MTEMFWLAGDIWRETWWIRGLSYLCLGVLVYLFVIRWWVSRQQFIQTHHWLDTNFTTATAHRDQSTNYLSGKTSQNLQALRQAYDISQISLSWNTLWSLAGFLSLIIMLVVYQQTRSGLFTLVVPIFVFGFASVLIYFKSLDQRQKLVEQVPLFLQALSNSLQAGYTLPMALEFIADEVEMPLQREVKTINQKLALQISLPEALEDFAKKLKNSEVDFFVESTLIQLKTGGNLIKLFNKIAYLIEEKLKLRRDIKSFTSQGKLSGILIAALWPISVLVFSWLSPTHTEVLFNTTGGQFMLALSLALELTGFFFIWKIISVKL